MKSRFGMVTSPGPQPVPAPSKKKKTLRWCSALMREPGKARRGFQTFLGVGGLLFGSTRRQFVPEAEIPPEAHRNLSPTGREERRKSTESFHDDGSKNLEVTTAAGDPTVSPALRAAAAARVAEGLSSTSSQALADLIEEGRSMGHGLPDILVVEEQRAAAPRA